jgi:tetrahydrodipicolinate N-succinyltransferase
MTKKFENIDKALNTSSNTVDVEITALEVNSIKSTDDDIKKDYDYARSNLYSLIEKGQEALNGIMELANDSDSPRAYEVAAQTAKTVGDTIDKLMNLQKNLKELENNNHKTTNNVTNNAVFVGSTSELQKLLKQGFLNNKDKQ